MTEGHAPLDQLFSSSSNHSNTVPSGTVSVCVETRKGQLRIQRSVGEAEMHIEVL